MVRQMAREDFEAELPRSKCTAGPRLQELGLAELERVGVQYRCASPFILEFASVKLKVTFFKFMLPLADDDLLETHHEGIAEGPNSFFTKIAEKLEGCFW